MPRIQITPMVKVALVALRIYLLLMLILIGISFHRMFSKSRTPSSTPAITNQAAPSAVAPSAEEKH